MNEKSVERFLLFVILAGYLIVGALFAIQTPDWQAPDEPAHYNYVAQVANEGCCPKIEVGDWDSVYLDTLKSSRFAPDLLGEMNMIQYEDHQPPLYYLLESVVYKLTNGSLTALRLFSVVIGLGIVLSAYGIGKVLLPDQPQIALGTAAFVAFLPQHVAILASVNNDSLSWSLTGLTLLATVSYVKSDSLGGILKRIPAPVTLGILVGVGLLTKVSALFLLGVVPLAIGWKWYERRASEQASLRTLAINFGLFFVPAIVTGGLWWLRNFGVYGFPDFLGLAAHNQVVADQLRTADRIAQVGFGAYLHDAWLTTFHSFWGQFGWMALPLPGWMYTVLSLLMLVVAGGWVITIRAIWRDQKSATDANRQQRFTWMILWWAGALAVLQYLYYNSEFYQVQARYMFSGLIPMGLLMAFGLDAWRKLLLGRFVWAKWGTAVVFFALGVLDVYVLGRFIPLLSP